MNVAQTGRGRPRKRDKAILVGVRFPKPMIDEIEAIIADRMEGADRSSVVRELVAEAIQARRRGD